MIFMCFQGMMHVLIFCWRMRNTRNLLEILSLHCTVLCKYDPPSPIEYVQDCIAQSVTCLTADTCLIADPGVGSSMPARPHTFVEIDHEMISTAIYLPSDDSRKFVVSYK